MTRTWTINGTLIVNTAAEDRQLLADPVVKAIALMDPPTRDEIGLASIDPGLSGVGDFCEHYRVPLAATADCVIVAGERDGRTRYGACLTLATTKLNLNTMARRHLGVDTVSVADPADAVERTGMDRLGFTAIGLPSEWPILVDAVVAALPEVVVGSGTRSAKLFINGGLLAELPDSEVIEGLAG